jgi:Yip1 domain
MIKALLLIFEPGVTWDKIVQAKKSLQTILLTYLVPMILISVAGELYGLLNWGKRQNDLEMVARISRQMALYYGLAQFFMSLAVVFIGAKLVKSVGETFHSRHNFAQCFTLVAYTLSPLFLVRLFDAFPKVDPRVTFAIGIILSITALYQGVPRILQPDPPHTFGLYLMSALLLAIVSGLARFLTVLLLQGKLNFF